MEKQHHYLKIHSSLGEDALVLEELVVDEGMSRLFTMSVKFLANERLKDMKAMVGEAVTMSLALGEDAAQSERCYHGHILTITELGKPLHNSKGQFYQATVVPRAWSATQRTNCRIFQKQTALQIIETILKNEHGVDLQPKTTSDYHTYEYCVQYNETDWDFACRLLAHEGKSFFFQHSGEKGVGEHKLIIVDKVSDFDPATESEVTFSSRPPGKPHINSWKVGCQATANAMEKVGFDYTRPATQVKEQSKEAVPGASFGNRELYLYQGEDATLIKSASLTELHLESITQQAETYTATSDLRSFGVGLTFGFDAHEDKIPDHNEFVIISHELRASCAIGSDGQPRTGAFNYSNSFTCMPTKSMYRPTPLSKPRIHGLQTATVTCGAGEEEHYDKHGRIKVQFHWDREGKHNADSSCWIRVAQAWAGAGYGAQFLPRKDQEVIVEFINGDPDQPLVTGSVYNGNHDLPYDPTAKPASSGIRSRSTLKGGSGDYSELRFDDEKGKEKLVLHAERDHELTVENDQIDTVKSNRLGDIAKDDTLTIGKDQSVEVGGKQKVKVGKTIELEAGQKITFKSGSASITLDSKGNIAIKGGNIDLTGSNISLKGSKISLN
ncbi:MAG: type VI secretion system tip protein VgrG [Marinobacter sp.]|nr:type VI secretion system tip protein VgrG [Marinobacter sp.]